MSKITKNNQLRLGLLGIGVFIGICGWSMFNQGKTSVYDINDWIKIEAIILESKTETVSMNNPSRTGPSTVTGWVPAITYKFNFNGNEYVNSRYTIMPSESLDFEKVKAIIKSYPKNSKHIVHVNPENPNESVLSREDKEPSRVHVIFGIILIVFGGGFIITGVIIRR